MSRSLYDKYHGGYRIFVGNVNARIGKVELEQEFERFGDIVDAWVARNPPGFAFLVFKTAEESERAVKRMDGEVLFGRRLRVEHANAAFKPARWPSDSVGPPRRQLSYQRSRSPPARSRSPPRRRSRSPAYRRRRSRSPVRSRRSPSPWRRDRSPRRGRSRSP